MRIGIISDIHADIEALEKTLTQMHTRQVDKVLCAGDLVEKGFSGDLVVECIQRHCIPSVLGNHDEAAIQDTQQGIPLLPPLAPKTITYLSQLPMTLRYLWEGKRIVVAHASPDHLSQGFLGREAAKRAKKKLLRLDVDVLVIGHSHHPTHVSFQGIHVVNPGSVCRTRPRDSHTYGILTLPSCQFEAYETETETPTTLLDPWSHK